MVYIVYDMNGNNHGNYFKVLGVEQEIKRGVIAYKVGKTFYPKVLCYRAKRVGLLDRDCFNYSEAIDYLIPEDYIRWKQQRLGGVQIES